MSSTEERPLPEYNFRAIAEEDRFVGGAARRQRVRARGRQGVPHLLRLRARRRRDLGRLPLARPRAQKGRNDETYWHHRSRAEEDGVAAPAPWPPSAAVDEEEIVPAGTPRRRRGRRALALARARVDGAPAPPHGPARCHSGGMTRPEQNRAGITVRRGRVRGRWRGDRRELSAAGYSVAALLARRAERVDDGLEDSAGRRIRDRGQRHRPRHAGHCRRPRAALHALGPADMLVQTNHVMLFVHNMILLAWHHNGSDDQACNNDDDHQSHSSEGGQSINMVAPVMAHDSAARPGQQPAAPVVPACVAGVGVAGSCGGGGGGGGGGRAASQLINMLVCQHDGHNPNKCGGCGCGGGGSSRWCAT